LQYLRCVVSQWNGLIETIAIPLAIELAVKIRQNLLLFLFSLCAVGSSSISGQTPGNVLRSLWDSAQQPWASMVSGAALSAEGRCVAIVTPTFVAVADKSARELWRWNFKEGNRFIVVSKIAVAPKCDWIAFAGDAGYRYIWIVHRGGKRIPVKTEGTPLAVEISHNGTLVAVGTGAGLVYLYGADGTLRWKTSIGRPPVQEVSIAENDSAVMVRSLGQTVISISGKVQWSGGVWGVGSSRPSKDFKAAVAWGEPPHGPGIGTVALLDGNGKTVWTNYYGNLKCLNFGVGGDRTEHVLWRFEQGQLDGLKPKAAVLMIGTNNSNNNRDGTEHYSTAEILEGVQAVVKQIRARLPDTKLLVLGIFPRSEKFNAQRGKLLQINQALAKLADGKMVHYLDFGSQLIEADGSISKTIMPDALHLSPAGYEIWAKAIEPKLKELLGK